MARLPIILLALQALCGAPALACAPLPAGTEAITAAPRMTERHQQIAERMLDQLRRTRADTLLAGDSITARWRSAEAELGRPVMNFGVSGDRTEHLLDRIGRADFTGTPIRRAVVLIGTNNTARDDACALIGGITAVIGRLHDKLPGARIYLVSILPRGPRMAARRALIEAVNAELAHRQHGLGITFVDAFTLFARACDGAEACPLLPDGLHPGPEGYAVLGRILREALDGG